jgi:hypothetical protein
MKKKKYTPPEIEKLMFRLTGDVLLGSIEHGQSSSAGGDLVDPPVDDPIDIGGLW